MESFKRIIVTGCNKGIGFGIIENLCQKNYQIIMACRNVKSAETAKETLEKNFASAKDKLQPMELDISDSKSVDNFVKSFKERFGTTDILLNNAAIAFHGDAFDENVAQSTLETNLFGTVHFTEKMLPLISNNGKVIIVGSLGGTKDIIKSKELLKKISDDVATKEGLLDLGKQFISSVADNTYAEKGWPKSTYRTSKLLINVYARVLGKDPNVLKRDIQVYSLCPGYVATDMSSYKGPLTIQQGAETPIYLVELPFEVKKEFQGQFFRNKALSSF